MQINLPKDPIASKGMTAHLMHKGLVLEWDVSQFPFRAFKADVLSRHINAYWASLPSARQDEIFEVYRTIRKIFDRASDVFSVQEFSVNALICELKDPCCQLINLHPFDDIWKWASVRQDIVVPASMKNSFNPDSDWMQTAAKTYTAMDYTQLTAMVVMLRSLIPVWGEFLFRTNSEISNSWKSYYALQLVDSAEIMTCIPMEKLTQYVLHNMPKDKTNAAATLEGASTEEYPTMLLATLLIGKVAVGDISKVVDETNLVTIIFNALGTKSGVNNGALFRNNDIRMKDFPEDGDGALAVSRIESMRAQMEIPSSAIVTANYYASKPFDVLEKIDKSCPPQLLETFSQNNLRLIGASHRIKDVQVLLTSYVVHKAMSARYLPYIDKSNVINCISVAQAVLWHWGFKQLAGLLSASVPNDAGMMAATGTCFNIPSELMAKLQDIYPYGQPAPTRKKYEANEDASQRATRRVPPVSRDIAHITEQLTQYEWLINLPKNMLEEVTGRAEQRRLPCPSDIRVQLAQLAIRIHSASMEK